MFRRSGNQKKVKYKHLNCENVIIIIVIFVFQYDFFYSIQLILIIKQLIVIIENYYFFGIRIIKYDKKNISSPKVQIFFVYSKLVQQLIMNFNSIRNIM